jgi:hypothetical protein
MRIYVLIVIAGHILRLASQLARAEENIKMCSSGSITLGSFSDRGSAPSNYPVYRCAHAGYLLT